jgi:hypothetical protein
MLILNKDIYLIYSRSPFHYPLFIFYIDFPYICINSPLLRNNGFGEGLSAMSFLLMQTLLPPATATASTRSTGLPFLFSFTFTFLLLFSFPFSFFIFRFFSFLFLFSFYFLFSFFIIPFSFLPSFIYFWSPSFRGREERNNKYYHHSIDNYRNNSVNFQKFLTIGC